MANFCFLVNIIISATTLQCPLVYAFQPHYYQQHSYHRRQYKVCNYVQREYYHRSLFQLFYANTDASIITYNRRYLIDTLGFTEEKLDKVETRKDEKGSMLTLEIGVLDERVNWLKDRMCFFPAWRGL